MSDKPHFFERARTAFKNVIAPETVKPVHDEKLDMLRDITERACRLSRLNDEPAFACYIAELREYEQSLLASLSVAPPDNAVVVAQIQGQLKAVQFALLLVPNALEDGRSAMRDLEVKEDSHG